MKTKIIAHYLPQFHRTEENDRWWGEGFTDWVSVKNAIPLYKGHKQPRVPLEGYYDLSDSNVLRHQANIATENGVYGFNIYHYWFSSEQNLLTKPALIILNEKDIDTHFMFTWDNGTWRRSWSAFTQFSNDWAPKYDSASNEVNDDGVLAILKYGSEDEWRKHFDYLLPFFLDNRYIRIEGKPLFGIYNMDNNDDLLRSMTDKWNEWAQENGLSGIAYISKKKPGYTSWGDYEYLYEPEWDAWCVKDSKTRVKEKIRREISKRMETPIIYSYSKIWSNIIRSARKQTDKNVFLGGFTMYDDSPRRGKKGRIIKGYSTELFKQYLMELLSISNKQNKEYLFLTAWNEWGEGAYMEPDIENRDLFLQAIRSSVDAQAQIN